MRYRKIFSLEILNDYFTNGQGGLYHFEAAASCKKILAAMGAFIKIWGNTLYVVVKIDANGKPLKPIPGNSVFEFFIEPLDSGFFNYTLASTENSREVFWIRDQPFPGGVPVFLTPGPVLFNSLKSYSTGTHVLSADGTCFRALNNVAPGSNLNDATKWSNLGQAASIRVSSRYYFHNAAPVLVEDISYLHPQPPVFNAANSYSFGDMVTGPADDLFEALKNLGTGSALNDTNAWANRGKTIYAAGNSLTYMHGTSPALPVAPATKTVIVEVFKVHPGNIVPPLLVHSESGFYEKPVSAHITNCNHLPSGLYNIHLNGVIHQVYLDASNSWLPYPAMVGIGHYSSLPASLALTDANGVLLSPAYSIRFAPKSVLWQLKYRGTQLPANAEGNGDAIPISFNKPGVEPNIFISDLPVRLRQEAYRYGILLLNNNDPPDQVKVNHLPAPALAALELRRENETDYLLTTTNLYS